MMQQPILIHVPGNTGEIIRSSGNFRPEFSRFPVPYAASELIPIPGIPIFRQQSRNFNFHSQLLEMVAVRDTELIFSVLRPTAFLVFMLEGEMTFYDEFGELISCAREKTFYLTYNHIKTYTAKIKQGPNRILVVALRAEWLFAERGNLACFEPLIEPLYLQRLEPVVLPHCHIGQTIQSLLERIMHYTSTDIPERGTGVFHLLTQCLTYYHSLLESGNYLPDQMQEIRARLLYEYIINNFLTEKVDHISGIAKVTGIVEWKIRELVYLLYGQPLHKYIISLRLEQACRLLVSTALKVREIAQRVGYTDEDYFSRAFKRFYGASPTYFRGKDK